MSNMIEIDVEILKKIEIALLKSRSIVSEAALEGFNPHEGNWVDSLYSHQSKMTKSIKDIDEIFTYYKIYRE
jgi:hypothetical protein